MILKFLIAEKSRFQTAGPVRMLRPKLPKVPALRMENAFVPDTVLPEDWRAGSG